ncbi:hypothetical protein STIUS_v1c03600 [Spiroplasma sp. TIUS-1]|uniref:DUF896 domain-containing protein n=1 Tax=Spiroplasma sp. TIUS-1 TaxID=216963 RepID=UPI001398ADF9|nr:DUF896 domain-containing protein [Spiroplasma sp. TIUS-1]QHX35914.1 hypothetical protein STIUS_v1c03600 [Spiroplasma sp. TIUS-1]
MEMDSAKIARINELAKIKKEKGLTVEESKEQKELRQEFIENFKAGFEQQLKSIKVVKTNDKK